ncbi:hypothetical protein GA0070606_3390 [Micromonospora citrea]|uniref:Uncharacterized protein n=1 Tax=Micromonospora citrea TaxID=47855 RepID=A0A1C6V433_9ACTN|nr:hypothetical protein [Micromonospora citrea]SCL61139.1 hypothetical protein GA0070606_3390 [Micromonospora citrea]
MSHQLFDELIGNPPPARVDVPGIVRRERRVRAARRLAGSLAAVLALAVTGAVGLAGGGQQPGGASAPPQAAAPTDTRFRLVFDSPESADATAERLSRAFGTALRDVAPGARWIWIPDSVEEPRKPDGQPPTFRHNGRDDLVFGGSGVSYQGREGPLGVSISPDVFGTAGPGQPAGYHWPCELPPGHGDSRYDRVCEEGKSPGGLRMKVETLTGKRNGSVQHIVAIQLPGNRAFSASISNMVGVDEQAVAAQPEAPLSAKELTALAVRIAEQIKA